MSRSLRLACTGYARGELRGACRKPTIAMAAATLDDLTGGRFILGVGSSHKVQVEAEHGMAYGKPLTRVRETVEVLRVPQDRAGRFSTELFERHQRSERALVAAL